MPGERGKQWQRSCRRDKRALSFSEGSDSMATPWIVLISLLSFLDLVGRVHQPMDLTTSSIGYTLNPLGYLHKWIIQSSFADSLVPQVPDLGDRYRLPVDRY